MGVPQFFHWLVTHYSKELLTDKYPHRKNPDHLYLDFNCAIHPAVKSKDFDTLDQMYLQVNHYLDHILDQTQPQKTVYIAVDGVAPLAKMKQQRYRRFKTIKDREELDKIDRKYKKYKRAKHDFNMISPGTEFMIGLTESLNQHIKTSLAEKLPNLKIILDDASNPGEGEHKIMKQIRETEGSVMVYGLDSDLIFLCLLHYRKDFCLFREKIFFDRTYVPGPDENLFTYLNLTNFRKIILSIMNPTMDYTQLDEWGILKRSNDRIIDYKNNKLDLNFDSTDLDQTKRHRDVDKDALKELKELDQKILKQKVDITKVKQDRLILDYITICFFLGNDFLSYLPSLKIKEGGFTRLIGCYKKVQAATKGGFLVKKNGLGFETGFLKELFRRISEYEDVDLQQANQSRDIRKRKTRRRISNMTDPYQKDIQSLEYIEDKWRDEIMAGTEDWQDRFYYHYLKSTEEEDKLQMAENYVEGLIWTLRYYVGNRKQDMLLTCPDWRWKYNYLVSPPASDIYKYLLNTEKLPEIKYNPPVEVDVQLLMIFPPQSVGLIKEELRCLMTDMDSPVIYQYPTDFKLEMTNHRYRWECYPILPKQDLASTESAVKILLDPQLKTFNYN